MAQRKIKIGKSGIEVPYLGLGTWAIGGGSWWGDNDDRLSVKTIQRAIELGIIWIDTAPIYGLYHSEKVVGEAIRNHRDQIILSTKCGLEWNHETPVFHKDVDGTKVYRDLSKKNIIEEVDHSLLNLETDYIDVLYTHWQSPDPVLYPIEETMDAMMSLKKQGKIRAIGVSNVTAEDIREYSRCGQLDVIQEKYTIAARGIEKDLVPVCKEYGISIQAYSPLEQGLLTGKFTMDTIFPEGDVKNNNPSFHPDRRKKILDILNGWEKYTEKYQCSCANLVIAFTARLIDSLCILAGARKPEQIEDNAKSLEVELEAADAEQMKKDIEILNQ